MSPVAPSQRPVRLSVPHVRPLQQLFLTVTSVWQPVRGGASLHGSACSIIRANISGRLAPLFASAIDATERKSHLARRLAEPVASPRTAGRLISPVPIASIGNQYKRRYRPPPAVGILPFADGRLSVGGAHALSAFSVPLSRRLLCGVAGFTLYFHVLRCSMILFLLLCFFFTVFLCVLYLL